MPALTDVKLSTISYVIIYVRDANKTKAFYRDTLGLKIKVDESGWVEFDTGTCTIALHSDEKRQANAPSHAIPVFGVKDIYATYEALKAKGV